jgi:Leucine-rich repeat (LRR) protein
MFGRFNLRLKQRVSRLHASTYVVATGVLLLLLLVNVPGQLWPTAFHPPNLVYDEARHGWPLVYLQRSLDDEAGISPAQRVWDLERGRPTWYPAAVGIDLAIAGIVLFAAIAGFEFWRRGRPRLLQLHLSDTLALLLVCAMGFGWYYQLGQARLRQQEAAESLRLLAYQGEEPDSFELLSSPDYFCIVQETRLPDWLATLAPMWRPAWLQQVVALNLAGEPFVDHSLVEMQKLPGLQALTLSPEMTDQGLVHLKPLEQLRILELGSRIGDSGMIHVSTMLALERLRLDATQVTDSGLHHISRLSKLRQLSLPELITNQGLAHLVEMDSLEHLDLSCTQVDDEGLNRIAPLVRLQRLVLPPDISDAGCASLELLSGLEQIDFHYTTSLTDTGLAHLAKLPRLRSLDLSEFDITDQGLKHLRGLTRLERLDLSGTRVTNEGLASMATLTALSSLNLSNTQITSAGLVHLSKLVHLKELQLSASQVDDEGLNHLASLHNLKMLSLRYTDVSDAGLDHLQSLENLNYLDLSGTRVSDAGLERLGSLSRLEHLSLEETQVSPQAVARLADTLPTLQQYDMAPLVGGASTTASSDETLAPGATFAPRVAPPPVAVPESAPQPE